jgi:hypothetical protein
MQEMPHQRAPFLGRDQDGERVRAPETRCPERKKAAGLDPAKDYTKDQECLPCHTVGYGKPGGYVDPKKTPTISASAAKTAMGREEPTSRMAT